MEHAGKAIVLVFRPLPLLSISSTKTVYSVVNGLLSGSYYEKDRRPTSLGQASRGLRTARILAILAAERSGPH